MMSILFGLCNVSQHPISRKEGEDTKTSKVFQRLEHVLVGEGGGGGGREREGEKEKGGEGERERDRDMKYQQLLQLGLLTSCVQKQ